MNRHYSRLVLLLSMLLVICMGCRDYDPIASGDIQPPAFDFATSHNIDIDVDYGELAAYAPVSIYEEDPMREATAENQSPVGEPINSLVLGPDGRYSGVLRLPTSARHLYLYSPSMGAPMIMESDVVGGHASAKRATSFSYTRAQTRAEGEEEGTYPGFRKLDTDEIYGSNPGNFYTLNGAFNAHGKVDDVNGLITQGIVTSKDIFGIQNLLWNGAITKPGGNTFGRRNIDTYGVDNVNMFIDEKYTKNGETYDVESAEVFFTFVGEYAWNENTIGYYYYNKKDEAPENANDLKKIIILPNASMGEYAPFGTHNSYAKFDTKEAPASINTQIQLLYAEFDTDGKPTKVTKHFPPNTAIGFFLIVSGFGAYKTGLSQEKIYINDSYPSVSSSRSEGKIQVSATKYYSNKVFNDSSEKRYIALSLKNTNNVEVKENVIVYGIEDSSDWSCDDFLFTLHSTPALALKPEAPDVEIKPVEPQKEPEKNLNKKSFEKTYAFEDIWPDGGDYDLSDVVVRHTKTITYDTKNSAVTQVDDMFTLVDDEKTEYKNAFAIVYPKNHRGKLTLPNGVIEETETGAIIITNDVRGKNGTSFTITRTFDVAIGLSDIEIEDINPFIINQTTGPAYTKSNRIEIHLPNHAVTAKGRPDTETSSPWFISRDKHYPYAIEIPNTTWVPCENGVRIGSRAGAYPNYNSWVESVGTQNADWYKNK